jgi:hypothetical protein
MKKLLCQLELVHYQLGRKKFRRRVTELTMRQWA